MQSNNLNFEYSVTVRVQYLLNTPLKPLLSQLNEHFVCTVHEPESQVLIFKTCGLDVDYIDAYLVEMFDFLERREKLLAPLFLQSIQNTMQVYRRCEHFLAGMSFEKSHIELLARLKINVIFIDESRTYQNN